MKDTEETNRREADGVLEALRQNPKVRQMRAYPQHGSVTTYDHCESVTRLSRRLNRLLRLHADETALVRGGMLHDFYLYDWHEKDRAHALHGFRHPDWAAENAARYVGVSGKEREIIRSHMWPLTITRIPRSREAWLVCAADKLCALMETIGKRNPPCG